MKSVLWVSAAALFSLTASAADGVVARVKTLQGEAKVWRQGSLVALSLGSTLHSKDVVRTSGNGTVGMAFADGTTMALGPNAELSVDEFAYQPDANQGRFASELRRGKLSVVSGRIAKFGQDRMTVRTPTTTLGIRGTEFLVDAGNP